jgi:hypothetical protein
VKQTSLERHKLAKVHGAVQLKNDSSTNQKWDRLVSNCQISDLAILERFPFLGSLPEISL